MGGRGFSAFEVYFPSYRNVQCSISSYYHAANSNLTTRSLILKHIGLHAVV
jgi:hypothetical protein